MTKKRQGSLLFPLLLVFIGLMFLLINLGAVDRSIWSEILRYWPVLLILAGVDTLLRRSSASAALATIISVGVLAAAGIMLFHLFAPDSWITRTDTFAYALDGAPSAEIVLSCPDCAMDIRSASEPSELISGRVAVRSDEKLTQSVRHAGGTVQFKLESKYWLPFLLSGQSEAQSWEARLNPSIPLTLSVETSGALWLDLSGLHVVSADVSAGDKSCSITLGREATTLHVSGEHIIVNVPSGVAVQITGFASQELDVPTGYVRALDVVQSPNYDTAASFAHIVLRPGAEWVEIRDTD